LKNASKKKKMARKAQELEKRAFSPDGEESPD
jgi:hypothetical protein